MKTFFLGITQGMVATLELGLILTINYATKYTTKMKPKFSYFDRIKFNVPALKPETPE